MRIVINGQQAFGADVLKALLERGEDVVAVYCAPDKEGRPPDPLAEAAREAGIEVRQPETFKTAEAADEMRALEPDLMVMAFVTLFVPEPVLNAPTHGSIQYHPSILPRHRGPSAINWAIIQGEDTTGLSVFWPDEGLDTGPVLQPKRSRSPTRTRSAACTSTSCSRWAWRPWWRRSTSCATARPPRSSRTRIRRHTRAGAGRPASRSTGPSPSRRGRPVRSGANPRPGAWTTIDGEQVEVLDCRPVEDDPGAEPGAVVAVDGDRLVVAAQGGSIAVEVVRADGDKTAASEYAREAGVETGSRLGGGEPGRRVGTGASCSRRARVARAQCRDGSRRVPPARRGRRTTTSRTAERYGPAVKAQVAREPHAAPRSLRRVVDVAEARAGPGVVDHHGRAERLARPGRRGPPRGPLRVGEPAGVDAVADEPVAVPDPWFVRAHMNDAAVSLGDSPAMLAKFAARARAVDALIAAARRRRPDARRGCCRCGWTGCTPPGWRTARSVSAPARRLSFTSAVVPRAPENRVADAQDVLRAPAVGLVADERDLAPEIVGSHARPTAGGEGIEALLDAAREAQAIEVAVGRRPVLGSRRRTAE